MTKRSVRGARVRYRLTIEGRLKALCLPRVISEMVVA